MRNCTTWKRIYKEVKNLVTDPKYAVILKDLRTRLKEWQVKTKDPWVVKYTHE